MTVMSFVGLLLIVIVVTEIFMIVTKLIVSRVLGSVGVGGEVRCIWI